jgi:hypothetical protein
MECATSKIILVPITNTEPRSAVREVYSLLNDTLRRASPHEEIVCYYPANALQDDLTSLFLLAENANVHISFKPLSICE